MPRYFRILYTDPRGEYAKWENLPEDIQYLWDWTWKQSPFVRWKYASLAGSPAKIRGSDLVVVGWPFTEAETGSSVKKAATDFAKLRQAAPQVPMMCVYLSIRGWVPTRFPTLPRKAEIEIAGGDLRHEKSIADAFKILGKSLPATKLTLRFDSKDLETQALVNWLRVPQLRRVIQRYFPGAQQAHVWPVLGGWSGTRLSQVFVEDGTQGLYYIKFFTQKTEYERELQQYGKAEKWLGDALVDLRLCPGISKSTGAQSVAWRAASPGVFPACYLSASDHDNRRITLMSFFRKPPAPDVLEAAYSRQLEILKERQDPRVEYKLEEPGLLLQEESKDGAFRLTAQKKMEILSSIDELSPYGPALCGNALQWRDRRKTVEDVFFQGLPDWLDKPSPVRRGHIHGDPNSRNCLVLPDDPTDLRLIDVGRYNPHGRMVLDLALIECDVKFNLMMTERNVPGFLDLDCGQLPFWCDAESRSLSGTEGGLDFNVGCVKGSSFGTMPLKRAYRLVGLVRERAQAVGGRRDPEGRHYFAALLYWTLNSLRFDTIRPTKKLLAIYSASEILRRFA